jgi:hypothetical protein
MWTSFEDYNLPTWLKGIPLAKSNSNFSSPKPFHPQTPSLNPTTQPHWAPNLGAKWVAPKASHFSLCPKPLCHECLIVRHLGSTLGFFFWGGALPPFGDSPRFTMPQVPWPLCCALLQMVLAKTHHIWYDNDGVNCEPIHELWPTMKTCPNFL